MKIKTAKTGLINIKNKESEVLSMLRKWIGILSAFLILNSSQIIVIHAKEPEVVKQEESELDDQSIAIISILTTLALTQCQSKRKDKDC